MLLSKCKMLIFFMAAVFFVVSCSGGGGSGDGPDSGTVSMSLMDLPNGLYKAVYVNISAVQIHKAGTTDNYGNTSWLTVGAPFKIYNLLELVNGVMESLGTVELETGQYTQVRLIIGEEIPLDQDFKPDKNINGHSHRYSNYVIDQSDAEIPLTMPLTIPSGLNTGIKLVHTFEVEPNSYTELILDFDAMRSIVETGNKKLTLKPTIKIIEATNYAEVSGKVTEATKVVTYSGEDGVSGVRVSAQTYDSDSGVITEQAATYTDSKNTLGYYRLIVEPNKSYNIVSFSKDYVPQCVFIDAENGTDYSKNFSLTSSSNSQISLSIDFKDQTSTDRPDVTVKFILLEAGCGIGAVTDDIQVESVVAIYDSGYKYNEIILPYGQYKLIASAEGYNDFEIESFTVNASATGPIEIKL